MDDAADHTSAAVLRTGLVLAAIGAETVLEITQGAVGPRVIPQGRAASRDRILQNLLNRAYQHRDLIFLDRAGQPFG